MDPLELGRQAAAKVLDSMTDFNVLSREWQAKNPYLSPAGLSFRKQTPRENNAQ